MKKHLIDPTRDTTSLCGLTSENIVKVEDSDVANCYTCLKFWKNNETWFETALRRRRNGVCKNCENEILVAIFKGGDWCSDDCRKVLTGLRR